MRVALDDPEKPSAWPPRKDNTLPRYPRVGWGEDHLIKPARREPCGRITLRSQMKPTQHNDSYQVFPYRSEIHDEGINNGGINLVENPEDIERITEAKDFPALRNLLVRLNSVDAATMTLGCAYWEEPDMVQGYVEFSFRDLAIATNESFIAGLDNQFYMWFFARQPEAEPMRAQLESSLAWEYSTFRYYETAPRLKIAVFYRAIHQQAASQLLDMLAEFLHHHIALPISNTEI